MARPRRHGHHRSLARLTGTDAGRSPGAPGPRPLVPLLRPGDRERRGQGGVVMRKLTVSGPPAGVPAPRREDVVAEQPPLAYGAALRALIGCAANTARLLR